MTTDVTALLAAIRANPDEDTPRLALADALDEAGDARMKCPTCRGDGRFDRAKGMSWTEMWSGRKPCPTCDGAGTVLDTGNRDRAELIRVQVDLASDPKNKYGFDVCRKCTSPAVKSPAFAESECCCRYKPLYARESALIAAHPDWLPPCPLATPVPLEQGLLFHPYHDKCEFCKDTGRIGAIVRGLCVVTVPTLATVFERRGVYDPASDTERNVRWLLTPYATKLRAGWPFVAEVWPKDRVPFAAGTKACTWTCAGAQQGSPDHLPVFLLNLLPQVPGQQGCTRVSTFSVGFVSPDAANRALACAVSRAVCDGGMS